MLSLNSGASRYGEPLNPAGVSGQPALRHEVRDHSIEGERVPVVSRRELDEALLVMWRAVEEDEENLALGRLNAAHRIGLVVPRGGDGSEERNSDDERGQESAHECVG